MSIEPKLDPLDTGVIVSNMWLDLAETIREGIADAYVSDGPLKAMIAARCAEACYWQANGESDAIDLKDLLPPSENP